MTLNDSMKHMQHLAELVASHVHHKVMLGGIDVSTDVARTG